MGKTGRMHLLNCLFQLIMLGLYCCLQVSLHYSGSSLSLLEIFDKAKAGEYIRATSVLFQISWTFVFTMSLTLFITSFVTICIDRCGAGSPGEK